MARCNVAHEFARNLSAESGAGPREAGAARRHRTSGFTMTELLVVIAIIGITMLIAFVAVGTILKNMQQAELDGTAKEIFVAAQNHLAAAEAEGSLEKKSEAGRGTPVEGEEGVYYFAVGDAQSKRALNRADDAHYDSVLYDMLPFGSIDETVRMDGTYVIKYDYNTATVLGVFYARSEYSSLFAANTEGFAFTDADYPSLFENPDYTGADKAQARQDYNGVMIGYYGGDDLAPLDSDALARPKLKVENAERLTAIVTNTNWDVDTGKVGDERLNPTLQLIVTGDTSGAQKVITLVDKGTPIVASYVESADSGKTFYVFLDDITTRGGHFAEIFGADGFLPGEDLTIQAVVFSSSRLSNVAQSNIVHRNSLFSSVVETRTATGQTAGTKARVSNIRHLENLSNNVSGYDPSNVKWNGNAPEVAEQTRDLSWSDFQLQIKKPVGETAAQTKELSDDALEARKAAAETVSTIELWNYAGAVNEGSFMPVSPRFALEYDGKYHRIEDVVVNRGTGNVGVFGDLTDASLHDLSLVNCSIRTGAGDAAALAGALNGTSAVQNVAAFNEADSDGLYRGADTDAGLEIRGTSSVGGLVGSMRGGTITNCAAAVYVRSTGGSAGGLLGWTVGSTVISGSYAGGHTVQGAHTTSTDEGAAGRANVIAAINAGGLVGNAGSATSLSIQDSYSTASTYGNDLSGGLVGWLGTGSITGCYSAAPVGVPEGVGAGVFVGGRGGAVEFAGNSYLGRFNEGDQMNDIGVAQAVAADESMASYALFANGTAVGYPYDGTLMARYNGTYPFKTIADITGADGLPLLARVHYGDWPALETFVVNVPS